MPNAVIESNAVPGEVSYLQVAFSSVVNDNVVDVVPDGSIPEGLPADSTGGVVSDGGGTDAVVKVWSTELVV